MSKIGCFNVIILTFVRLDQILMHFVPQSDIYKHLISMNKKIFYFLNIIKISFWISTSPTWTHNSIKVTNKIPKTPFEGMQCYVIVEFLDSGEARREFQTRCIDRMYVFMCNTHCLCISLYFLSPPSFDL